jgi:pimeloyl-ACP methyl ester carboxylesterase
MPLAGRHRPALSGMIVAGMTARDGEIAMSNQRTHYATTADGVAIGGTVHGQGPPLVFLHAVIGDGDLDWQELLPHLTGRFTCHLPSWRGRGRSGDHPDLSPSRLVDDFRTYVDSIGQATGLVGWGAGAGMALAVAAQSDAVDAVAPIEPLMSSLLEDHERAGLGETLARVGELAAEGSLTAAVRTFGNFVLNAEEVAELDDAGYFEAAGRYVPNMLNLFRQSMEYEGPSEEDPAVLGAISAPVLVLHGSETKRWFIASAPYVADHVPNGTVHEIPGAGLASPLTHPKALAEVLTGFFSPAQQPA